MYEFVKYSIEFIFSLAMVINALLFIPQAINIYKTKSAKGLSLTTFAGFNIMQIFTILHAYLRNDYVLMFGMGLSFIFCGITTLFIIKYR